MRVAGEYQEIFGKGRFFLEVQDHRKASDKAVQKQLMEISRQTSIPLVATNDVHYLRREDAPVHEALLCLGRGEVLWTPTILPTDRTSIT